LQPGQKIAAHAPQTWLKLHRIGYKFGYMICAIAAATWL